MFRRQKWKLLSSEWDHDHCRGCGARFAANPVDWKGKVYTEGWVTLLPGSEKNVDPPRLVEGYLAVPSPKLDGFQSDWLCPECFDTCKDKLEFVVAPSTRNE